MKFQESGASDELSEDQLDNIAGGGLIKGIFRTAVSTATAVGFGAFCGICPAATAATPYVAGGLTAWSALGFKK